MCFGGPSIEAPPPPAERQVEKAPKYDEKVSGYNARRRRGMWASVFTGPQGITGAPTVTGSAASVTGG